MWKLSLDELRSTAYPLARHEAGHFIVARALGYVSDEVFIVWSGPDEPGNGGNLLALDRQFASLDEVVTYCSDRVLILYAGSMAENILCGQVNDEQVCDDLESPKAADDNSKVRENLRIIAGIERCAGEPAQAALNRVKDRLWHQASSLVIRLDREIEELAGALQRQIEGAGEKAVIADWASPELGAERQEALGKST